MMRRVVILLCVAACGSKKAPPSASGSLWALAPPGTELAVVVRDGTLPLLLGAVRELATRSDPAVAAQLRAALNTLPVDVLDDAALNAAGIDVKRAAAVFVVEGHPVLVGLFTDGDKLRNKLGGGWRCVEVKDRIVCADADAALANVGASATLFDEVQRLPSELRGDVEVYRAISGGTSLPIENPRGLWVAAQLGPGAMTVRARLGGKVKLPPIPAMALARGLADERPEGLIVAQVGDWLAPLTRMNATLPGGVNVGTLAGAMTGEVVGWVPPGRPARGFVRIGIKDAPIARRLLDACDELAMPPLLASHKEGDRCKLTVTLPQLGTPIPVEAWLADGALAVALGDHTAKAAPRGELSPFAREVLEGKWVLASWGRGLYAEMMPKMISAMGAGGDPGVTKVAASLMSHLTEMGFAVGWDDEGFHALYRVATTYANPDEVVTALEPLLTRLAGGDATALAEIEALARRHPGSPLGEAVQASPGGVAAAVFVPAVLAAVAIPAFMRNARKAKTIEASVNVKKLYDGARSYYDEGPAKRFPSPSVPATPPATCCGRPGDKCAPEPALWTKEPWRSLKFSLDDPHYYRYEYEVAADGRSFSARALGDLDCDGVYSTFEMVGDVAPDGTVTGASGMFSDKELE